MEQLLDCFPQVEVLHSFNILDPQSLPKNEKELLTYDREKLQVFLKVYGGGSNAEVDIENNLAKLAFIASLVPSSCEYCGM